METCARCGKELSFRERKMIYWNHQLQEGYIKGPPGSIGLNRIDFPEYKGKKICAPCYNEVYMTPQKNTNSLNRPLFLGQDKPSEGLDRELGAISSPFKAMKDKEYTSCINGLGLLDGEKVRLQYVCSRQTVKPIVSPFVVSQQPELKKGLLVFTNSNMIFMQQDGFFSSNYSQALRVPLENISGMVVGGMMTKHIRINVGTSGFSQEEHFTMFYDNNGIIVQMEGIKKNIEQALKDAREEKKKASTPIHIVLDFSSLKDVMSKGGLVMTTYKCPNCNGMVKLPEEGKVLMCEYCGTPIKPVDIFEKIKSLIQ